MLTDELTEVGVVHNSGDRGKVGEGVVEVTHEDIEGERHSSLTAWPNYMKTRWKGDKKTKIRI